MINVQSVQVFVCVIFKIIFKKYFRKRLKLANLFCSRIHPKMGKKYEKINC